LFESIVKLTRIYKERKYSKIKSCMEAKCHKTKTYTDKIVFENATRSIKIRERKNNNTKIKLRYKIQ
jgi:hypothetical protein